MLKNIKRIGKKTFKFQVDVFFEKVDVNIKFPCQLFVIWKRGPRKQETKPVNMDVASGSATFNEYLQMGATLFQDVKTKKYQEKKTSFTIVISTPKGNKVAGACELDLGSYPNQGIQERKEVLSLKKSPDPNAKLHIMIKVVLLAEADNMSVLSGITEQDSFDEAGSGEVSQLDYDTTRVHSSSVTSNPVSKQNTDNILAGISSRAQLQQEIKEANSKQEEAEEEDEEENTPPKTLAELKNAQQDHQIRKSYTEVRPTESRTGTGPVLGSNATASAESKRAGFNKLFEKNTKNAVSEASTRFQSKLGQDSKQNGESRAYQDRDNLNGIMPPSEVDSPYQKQSGSITEDGGRDAQALREELSRKQNEFNKMKNLADQLRKENQELKQGGSAYSSVSDEVMELRERINEKNREISDLSQQNNDLQQNIDELKQTIYKINKEKGEDSRNITKEIDKLKVQIKQIEQEKAQLQQENHNLSSRMAKHENDFKNLRSDYNALKQEKLSIQESYNSILNEKEDISQSSQHSEMELKRYKDKILTMDQEIQRLREQVKEIQTEKEGYQRKGMEMSALFKDKMRAAEEENNNLKGRLQELDKSYREQVNKSENNILELKKQLKDSDGKKEEALSKQTQLAIDLQKLKIEHEKVKSELEYIKEAHSTTTKDIDATSKAAEKETTKLREKLASMESYFKTREIEYQQKFDQLKEIAKKNQQDCEAATSEKERLENRVKTLEHEASLNSVTHNSTLEQTQKAYNSEVEVMKKNLEIRDAAFNNLKKENKSLLEQVDNLKKKNADLEAKTTEEKPQASGHMAELQNQFRLTENNWNNQMKELKEENSKLKKELSTAKTHTQASQDVENQVAQLSIENETLKKQVRELTAKLSSNQSSAGNQLAKENEELKKKEKDLKKTITKLEEDSLEIKTKLAKLDGKTKEDDELIAKLNKKIEKSQESVSLMETELVKAKQKMGEIMNVIMESAESDLVDKVHSVVYENNY